MGVKAKRDGIGMSALELSRLSGISQPTIWRIENHQQEPLLSTAFALAKALGCKVEELLEPDPAEQERPGA